MENQSDARLDAIEDRLRRLEKLVPARATHRPAKAVDVETLIDALTGDLEAGGDGVVVYAGTGPWREGRVVWEVGRRWPEVLAMDGTAIAVTLSALASPLRIAIITALLSGQQTTAELAERLEQPSSGQLFHHLKDLMAAGVVHQPMRGVYEVDANHVVPLLAIICASLDLAPRPRIPEAESG